MLPILIVPKYFLALGIFAAFMKSFGVSLTPLVLGGIFYEIISSLDPILLTLLGIWTIWKVLILRRPLVDINYWKHRMGVRFCSRRSSNWSQLWRNYASTILKNTPNLICFKVYLWENGKYKYFFYLTKTRILCWFFHWNEMRYLLNLD